MKCECCGADLGPVESSIRMHDDSGLPATLWACKMLFDDNHPHFLCLRPVLLPKREKVEAR